MKQLNIFLLILWMIVIFSFSQDSATSSSHKSNKVAHLIINIIGELSHQEYDEEQYKNMEDKFIFLIRKGAHFFEYMILGILITNVVKDYYKLSIFKIILIILFCMFYACTDEFHQLFIFGRSGKIMDVLIDTLGGSFGSLCFMLVYNYRKKVASIIEN